MEDGDSMPSAKKYYDSIRMMSPEIVEEGHQGHHGRGLETSPRENGFEIVEEVDQGHHSRSLETSPRENGFEIVEEGDQGHHIRSLETSPRDNGFGIVEEGDQGHHSWSLETSTRDNGSEIVELDEEHHSSKSVTISTSRDRVAGANDDVYVAVGKDDSDVVKWAIEHVVSPGAKVYLVHIYPPVTYIPTPVGKLSRSQLTQDQVRFYLEEEENKRRNLLQKYITLCNDAKVKVDTVLVEHNATAKAIVDLITFHNITILVMGIKKPPNLRILKKRLAKGEHVKKSAPEFCEVTIVSEGKKVVDGEKVNGFALHTSHASSPRRSSQINRHPERNMFLCGCFSGKSYSI
ncbi:Universal stress protein [Trema orientale]|uniref:Universal stress protein n=1 Tax=Trema orientale TaxID=63057 RepID=A0A2P5FG13_TREOI|nr:Universal stress protein [Trema orientale]